MQNTELLTIADGGIQTTIPELAMVSPQIIYLDFDGELTSYHNRDLDIHIDDVDVEDSGLTQERIASIVKALNDDFANQNVIFVNERPTDTDFSTIYVGKTSSFDEYGNFAGLAETVDIDNQIKNDNAFVMLDNTVDDSAIIETISHEARHLVGTLEHGGEEIGRYAKGGYIYYYYLNNQIWQGSGNVELRRYTSDKSIISSGYLFNGENVSVCVGTRYVSSIDVTLDATSMCVYFGGVANNTIVNSNGTLELFNGVANNTMVNSNGTLELSSGVANNTTVNSGGTFFVYSGTAHQIVENGGGVYCWFDANVSFVPNVFSNLVLSSAGATLHSGTTAISTNVCSDGVLAIFGGGMANATTVCLGGRLFVGVCGFEYNGGWLIYADFFDENNSGVAISTTVSSGGIINVCGYGNGRVIDTTVNSGGALYVDPGGTTVSTVVSSGGNFHVYENGMCIETTVNSGGILRLEGTAVSTIIKSGGDLILGSSCILKDSVLLGGTINRAWKNVDATEANIIFDITERSTNDSVIIYNITAFDVGTYSISVSSNQAKGQYKLAGYAAGFDKTITVRTESGQVKGELYLGMTEPVNCNGVRLTLKLDETTNVLYVDVNSNYSEGTDRENRDTEVKLPKDAFDTFGGDTIYTIAQGPEWLNIDENTGEITGKTGKISDTETGYGDTEVIVQATDGDRTVEHHIDLVVVPEDIEGMEVVEPEDEELADEVGSARSMTDLIAGAVKNRNNSLELSWSYSTYWNWLNGKFFLDRSKIGIIVTDTDYNITIQCELRIIGLLPSSQEGKDCVIKADLFGEDYIKLSVARDFSKFSAELVGTITIENLDIAKGLFTLESAELSVTREEGDPSRQRLTGKVDKLHFKYFETSISGELSIVDGALDRIVISVSGMNIPVASTGLFVTSIGGGVENLQSKDADKPVTIIGEIGMRYGAEITVNLPKPFGFFNGNYSVAELDLDGKINVNGIGGEADVKFLGGVITANVLAELNWKQKTLEMKGECNILNCISGNGAFRIDSGGNFTIAGTSVIDFAAWNIPILGSMQAERGMVVTFSNDGNMGNDYIMVWTGGVIFGQHVTIGSRAYFNGVMEQIGNDELREMEQEMTTRAGSISGRWDLTDVEGTVLLAADWSDGAADAVVRLTDADGNTYSLADLDRIDGIELVEGLCSVNHKVIALDSFKTGVWELSVEGVEDAKVTASLLDKTLSLTAPALDVSLNENHEVTLTWDAALLINGERVSIFYDDDAADYDGCLIVQGTAEELNGSYTWTMPNEYDGNFNFYMMVDAANAVPVFGEYSQSITVQTTPGEVDFDDDSAYIYVDEGYTITGRTIGDGMTVIVDGGEVNGMILESGASLRLYGDTVMTGSITIDAKADVVENGNLAGENVELCLLLPNKANETAFISSLEMWDVSSLTLIVNGSMELGRYLLTTDGGAEGIIADLSVMDEAFIGSISLNTCVRQDGRMFCLETDQNGKVYLAVHDGTAPMVIADVTAYTAGNVTVTAEFIDDCVAREYSFDGEIWMVYEQPVVMDDNGSLYFRGKLDDGTITATTKYDIANIDRTAPVLQKSKNVISGASVSLTITASEALKEILYSMDGSEWFSTTDNAIRITEDGVVQFKLIDIAGNVSEIYSQTISVFNVQITKMLFSSYEDGTALMDWSEDIVAAWTERYDVDIALPNGVVSVNGFIGTGVELLNAPPMEGEWRVKSIKSKTWSQIESFVKDSGVTSTEAHIVNDINDGKMALMFARGYNVWNDNYEARHVGVGTWDGTGETAVLDGRNVISDIFAGSDDASILLMTDDENGDALFIDDIYSSFPEGVDAQARLAKIDEIRAGAGDDVIDLTSQRFDYVGGGMTVHGGLGDDVVWANNGDNTLFGDAGNDRIVGAGGNDVIVGGSGNDSMHGGGGEDIFAFGGNWGNDSVEQLADGKVTLWFEDGSLDKWDASTLTYQDGENSVKVSGVAADNISLKFGDDDSQQYGKLLESGAFDEFSSERIFENKNTRGMLA